MSDGPRIMASNGQNVSKLGVLCKVCEVPNRIDEILNITFRLREDFSRIKGFELSENMLLGLDCLGQTMEQHAAFVCRHLAPLRMVECFQSNINRAIDIDRRACGDL